MMMPGIEELPGDLKRLAEVLEESAPGHGVRLALVIEENFRGTYLRINNIDHLRRRWRDQEIKRRYDQGEAVIDIARSVGLCDRQIWNVLKTPDARPDKQMRMFE